MSPMLPLVPPQAYQAMPSAYEAARARALQALQNQGIATQPYQSRPPAQGSAQGQVVPPSGSPSALPGGSLLGVGTKYAADKIPSLFGAGGAMSTPAITAPTSLPTMTQLGNMASGLPANAVQSVAMPGGEAGIGLASGATVPAAEVGALGLPTTWGSGTMGTVGPIASVVAAIHGGSQFIKNFGRMSAGQGAMTGLETGAGIGGAIGGPAGAAIGAPIGALAGLVGSMFHSGKHEDQYKRDSARRYLQQVGILDEGFNLDLADGSKFNVGLDGGARAEYAFSGGRRPYEINEENPLSQQASVWGIALAEAMFPGDEKLMSDFSGYFANAAMSNAQSIEGVRANVLNIAAKAGLTQDQWVSAINNLHSNGMIDSQRAQVLGHSINALFSGDPKHYDMRSVAQVKQELSGAQAPLPGGVASSGGITPEVGMQTTKPLISPPQESIARLIEDAKANGTLSNPIYYASPDEMTSSPWLKGAAERGVSPAGRGVVTQILQSRPDLFMNRG